MPDPTSRVLLMATKTLLMSIPNSEEANSLVTTDVKQTNKRGVAEP